MTRTASRRVSGIDGLRGLAACAVLAFHFETETLMLPPGTEGQLHYGLLGVELFFVISGFVILKSLERASSIGSFAQGRAARILPTYWLSVFCAVPFVLASGRVTWANMAANLSLSFPLLHRPSLVSAYWTLTYEVLFYVALATLVRLRLLHRIEFAALAWLAVLVVLRLTRAVPTGGAVDVVLMTLFGHFFIIGMMLHRIATARVTPLTWFTLGCAVAYSGFGRPDWANIASSVYLSVTIAFAILVFVAARYERTVLSAAPLVALGAISYPLYLFHQIAGKAVRAAFPGGPLLVLLIMSAALAVAMAAAVHFRVEVPAQRWLTSLRRRRVPAGPKPVET